MNAFLRRFLQIATLCGATLQLSGQAIPANVPQVPGETVQFVTVEENVKLEVVDWGGAGRPLIFLAGMGYNAHSYAPFIAKLVPNYHVYSLTRRGFPPSSISKSESDYSSDRLGDDVAAVIDALKIQRPILVGHSVAGEELSSVGTRHPEKVSGLIYLEAGYGYALYDQVNGDWEVSANEAFRELAQLQPEKRKLSEDPTPIIDQLLVTLPQLEKALTKQKQLAALNSDLEANSPRPRQHPPRHHNSPGAPNATVVPAIIAGAREYTSIHVPILAIFAHPHFIGNAFKDDPKRRAELEEIERMSESSQIEAFERQLPSAHVVCLPDASHDVISSNEADVLREMTAFIGSLPAPGDRTLADQTSANGEKERVKGTFQDTSAIHNASPSEPPAEQETMYLRGSMNKWGKTAMALVDADTWKVTIPLAPHTAYSFKFDAWGDWTRDTNWGGSTAGATGAAEADGGNLSFTTGSATSYTFTFNEHTLAYSVEASPP
jgi:pimeloyl-ACP methyl ester carboxylesterase